MEGGPPGALTSEQTRHIPLPVVVSDEAPTVEEGEGAPSRLVQRRVATPPAEEAPRPSLEELAPKKGWMKRMLCCL